MLAKRLLVASALLATAVLSGCSDIEDAASDAVSGAANETACSVVRSTTDGITTQVDRAADEIDADPEAARDQLSGLLAVLERARDGLSGDAQRALSTAADALGDLVGEARQAARGVDVDTSAVDGAKDAFGDAVDDVQDIC